MQQRLQGDVAYFYTNLAPTRQTSYSQRFGYPHGTSRRHHYGALWLRLLWEKRSLWIWSIRKLS